MLEYRTQGFNGYAVKYSPFFDSRIAVASSQHFGLVGNGRLYVLGLTPKGIVAEKWYPSTFPQSSIQIPHIKAHKMLRFDTQDSLFDLAWSESHENQVLVAAGDGSIKLFDIGLDEFPVQSWKEHMREVFAVHWNLVSKDTFCSSSWDGTIRVVCCPSPPTPPGSYGSDIVTVESHPPKLPPHPAHPLLHLLRLFLPTLALRPLLRLQRLALPPLRPPHPCLRLKSPRPHDPYPLSSSAHPALLYADTRASRSVPAKRSAHA